MTAHNGRGRGDDLPYEGVVLPANGDPWTPEEQREAERAHAPQPTAGRPWGQPWGPQTPTPPTSPPSVAAGEEWTTEGRAELPYHSDSASPPAASADGQWAPPPPSGPPPGSPPASTPPGTPPPPQEPPAPPAQQPGYGDADATQMLPPHQPAPGGAPDVPPSAAPGAGPLPQEAGSEATQMLSPLHQHPQQPYEQPQPQAPHQQPQPQSQPQAHPHAQAGQGTQAPEIGEPWPPPQPPHGDAAATQMLPPQQPAPYGGPAATGVQQWPSGQGEDPQSRQPHQTPPGYGDADATQMLPPQQPGAGDADATQMLPPQAADGALPPETGYGRQQAVPSMDSGPPPGGATYGMPPGGSGDRQPLSEFDNLFRSDAGQHPGGGAAHRSGPDTTPNPPAYGRAARRDADRAGRGPGLGKMSPAMLAGIGLVAVLAVGLGVGALISGGDGEEPKAAPDQSAAPVGGSSAAPADTAETQAEELNKLLEKSNNSRNAVIRAVQNIKACKKLGQAAADLRAAADQREGLVAGLSKIETGALPDSESLNSALTEAWQASAKADMAYAAWAGQVAGKKGCHKGEARSTRKTAVGNRASGEATTAKKEAAGLWNPTAQKYGLPERQYTQL